ncbi:MAG: glycine cleavage system protein H [Deltaproteobacteria bacterium]|nr:glycine cleavage system protein H [Deltaproteobacteria bacterium]
MDLNKLKYSTELVWVRLDDERQATIGLTEEALRDYTELSKIRLPSEGEEYAKDDTIGHVFAGRGRGLKIIAPLSGEVLAVNDDLLDTPEVILEDPYEDGWLIKLSSPAPAEVEDLMTRYEYEDFVEEELDDEEDSFLSDDDDYDDDDDEDDFDDEDDDYFDDDDEDDY